jgi:two-component system cell cycle sensor histidine kinase/response regulator CckA
MTTSLSTDALGKNKYSIPLLITFIAAGLAGNYFKYPIFLNIDFLFGSIFAMLALQFFGLGRGIVAAVAIAGYTYVLWNHPYAIIIMTAEVAVVGWLMTRRKIGMVLADALYWLVIGMPLVYLFYHVIMHVPPSNTYIVMIKQAVNGIANTLVARLIFNGYAIRSRTSQLSYREIVYNLMSFFVLCPTLILLALASRSDFKETDWNIRSSLDQSSQRLDNYLDTWVLNRKNSVVHLAKIAASRSPQQMQLPLEQTKESDANFLRVGLLDREATITAYFPLIDELGQKNIGKNFADRPFIPKLKQTLKPMLSEVVMGKIGTPKPIVSMLAPVIVHGEYDGYIAGIMNLDQVKIQLDKSLAENNTLYTLLDKNGNIILTNRPDQKQMSQLLRGEGSLKRLDKNISQWIPKLPHNTPISERWKKSLYISEAEVGDLAEWKLVLEQPVAPFQKKLYDNYTGKLAILFLLLLVALALAEYLSRRIVVALEQLCILTNALPIKLEKNIKDFVWPESSFEEANHLIENFKEMTDTLAEQNRK